MSTKILVVDDEMDVEMLFTQKFRREIKAGNYVFHFAFSGEDALNFMKTLNPFDIVLVLSDINMPGMTGLELLRQTKVLFPQLRVVMVTAYGDEKNFNEAKANGADDFLTKPVDFDLLKQRLSQLYQA
jgi:CheY-like chemotaxis protein